jgi:hypothetical protein
MAHALPKGRSILNLRSTRITGRKETSNIVWNYGHMTIPRHLRDIVVTEFGIADIRGKTDKEIIVQLLNISDSRFQQALAQEAKKNGKISRDGSIKAEFKRNHAREISQQLKRYKEQGYFQTFPFGTDFTEEEIFIGKALKILKKKQHNLPVMIATVLKAFLKPVDQKPYAKYLKRMGLEETNNFAEKLFQKLLTYEFSQLGKPN